MASWPTAITDIADGDILVRGYPLQGLIGARTFAESLALLFGGELPGRTAAKMVEAVLTAALDHGTTSPSALTARTVVSGGAPARVGAAAGLLALNRYHGAAVEDAAHLLRGVVQDAGRLSLSEAARAAVTAVLERGERVPGFGHRVHAVDPRVARLFALADEERADGRFVAAARAVEGALSALRGRHFPMNLDAAIAAVLLPYLDPAAILGVFMASRFCGIYAQACEESRRMKPMRRIEPGDWAYDGPPRREVGP